MKTLKIDLNKVTFEGLKAYLTLLKEGAVDVTEELPKIDRDLEDIPEPPEYP